MSQSGGTTLGRGAGQATKTANRCCPRVRLAAAAVHLADASVPRKRHSQGMTRTVAPDRTFPAPDFGHVSNAPIERVAVADWVLRLSSGECARRLPPADIALWLLRPGRLIVVYTAPSPLTGTVAPASDVAGRSARGAFRES